MVSSCWDLAAAGYDDGWSHGLHGDVDRAAWAAVLDRLLPGDRPLSVLDAGCGTGFLAVQLARAGHRVVGLDQSGPMLDKARPKIVAEALDVELVEGDVTAPPAGLGPFDAVVCRHLLSLSTVPEATVRGLVPLVAPGGRMVAFDAVWRPLRVGDRLALAAGRALTAVRERRRPGDMHLPGPDLPLHASDDLATPVAVLRRGGLLDVRAEWLPTLDTAARAVMPPDQRLAHRFLRNWVAEGVRQASP